MKIEVDKHEFVSLLSKTQNIVEKRSSMPILVNVLLESEPGRLKIFATDLQVSLTDEIAVPSGELGRLAINARSLFDVVKELDDGPVFLSRKDNNWLEIQQKRSVFNIVGINAEEYPVFPSYVTDDFLSIDAQTLGEMIDKTIYAVSNDQTRYQLNGVYLQLLRSANGQGTYRMLATDGHRLALVDRTVESGSAESFNQGVIIPRKGLIEVRKLVDSASGSVEMAVEGAQLIVRHKSTILLIRLIEGRYPNYQQLIPQTLRLHALVQKEALLTSVKRVSLFSNQKYKGVTFSLSENKLEVSSINPEMGNAHEGVEVQYCGEAIKVGFNARYLLEVLASVGADVIDIGLNDQLSPCLVRPHDDESQSCVVMPMRI